MNFISTIDKRISVLKAQTDAQTDNASIISSVIEDELKALNYYRQYLLNETLIQQSQHEDCEVVIIVPVFNESQDRILQQVFSIIDQKDISKNSFELIYILNSGQISRQDSFNEVIKNNQKILDLPIWKNRMQKDILKNFSIKHTKKLMQIRDDYNLYIIDKSGRNIDYNVGKARNRGIAEASYRFYQNEKNGILLQTDADAVLEDRLFLNKVISSFNCDHDIIGISGGISYRIDPDIKKRRERKFIKKILKKTLFNLKITSFAQILSEPPDKPLILGRRYFNGANMLSRSYESAIVGGVTDASFFEEAEFSKNLIKYSETNKKKIIIDYSLCTLVSLRESLRTDRKNNTFLSMVQKYSIPDNKIDDPFAPDINKFSSDFRKQLLENIKDQQKLLQLFSDNKNRRIIQLSAIKELQNIFKDCSSSFDSLEFTEWKNKYFHEQDSLVNIMYRKKFPKLKVNRSVYKKLLRNMLKTEKGRKMYNYISEHYRMAIILFLFSVYYPV